MNEREAKLKAIKEVCADHFWGRNGKGFWNFTNLAEDVMMAITQVEIDQESREYEKRLANAD